jgi:hypothetical protein
LRRRASAIANANEPQFDPAARAWSAVFAGDATRAAYQLAFRARTPAGWELVASAHSDLLRLLINRVPAELGVGAVFGLAVLFGGHPKGEDAGRALLATLLTELEPARARTLLVTLSEAWLSAEGQSFDQRAPAIQADLARAVRRLLVVALPESERDALRFVAEQLADIAPATLEASEIVPRERHAPGEGVLKRVEP